MPDDFNPSVHISLRVPSRMLERYDRLAAILDRPRSWVILRALSQYLEAEGAEVEEDEESIAELDRGDSGQLSESIEEAKRVIAEARTKKRTK